MKKFKKRIFPVLILIISVFAAFYRKSPVKVFADEKYYYISGEVFGFSLISEGITVIGLSDVVTNEKTYSPAKDAGIKPDDVITKINENKLKSDSDIDKYIKSGYNELDIISGGKTKNILVKPAKDINGNLRLGIFIRGDICGIGTVSYYDSDGRFSALGHEIYDKEYAKTPIIGGALKEAGITKIIKGTKGIPGEIQGYIKSADTGTIEYGISTGIYGEKKNFDKSAYQKIAAARRGEAKIGKATAISNISGSTESYDIKIVKVTEEKKEKNLVIKVNDEKLLSLTGGIVQGMSGTPIIQNGKLIGIITHVFINDPKSGYGLSIQNSLDNFN